MSSEGILIECEDKAQADAMLSIERLANLSVKALVHRSLSSCLGAISDPALEDLREDDILEGL
ncbi:hypothetical protein HPB48_002646 [Haemaphysalis longicornis]|uniref:Uncharacterized protein n=1 Tax=Haemaphysalis longicornis TaxID=44386 RepID=A0A9J6G3A3_HAELO|nr:hypothetical protein HPB48_002646 [Haemaphysalis longicornis]